MDGDCSSTEFAVGAPSGAAGARFWERYARVYDRIWDSPLTDAVNRQLWTNLPAAGQAVDLGCGTGLSSGPLRRLGWSVTGVDQSPAMLERAVQHGRITTALCRDAATTGLPSSRADLVLVSNLLHLTAEPVAVLDEAWRLLAPAGLLAVVWPASGATLGTALRADLRAGRAFGRSLAAAFDRLGVGLAGVRVGARAHSGAAVADVVDAWVAARGAVAVHAGSVFDVECYLVVSKPGNHRA